jgi:hypothetical protein
MLGGKEYRPRTKGQPTPAVYTEKAPATFPQGTRRMPGSRRYLQDCKEPRSAESDDGTGQPQGDRGPTEEESSRCLSGQRAAARMVSLGQTALCRLPFRDLSTYHVAAAPRLVQFAH